MKIYSQIVFDIDSGKIISEVSENYHGQIAECKGGSSTTTTVDPVYNAGLLEISKQQQGWAGQMFNKFKYGTTYDPTENVTGYYDQSGKFVEGKPEAPSAEAVKPGKIDLKNAPSRLIDGVEGREINPEYNAWIKEQQALANKKSADATTQAAKN